MYARERRIEDREIRADYSTKKGKILGTAVFVQHSLASVRGQFYTTQLVQPHAVLGLISR